METREKEKSEAAKQLHDPKATKQEKINAAKVITKPKRKPLL